MSPLERASVEVLRLWAAWSHDGGISRELAASVRHDAQMALHLLSETGPCSIRPLRLLLALQRGEMLAHANIEGTLDDLAAALLRPAHAVPPSHRATIRPPSSKSAWTDECEAAAESTRMCWPDNPEPPDSDVATDRPPTGEMCCWIDADALPELPAAE